jgi:hypothetical protein
MGPWGRVGPQEGKLLLHMFIYNIFLKILLRTAWPEKLKLHESFLTSYMYKINIVKIMAPVGRMGP